MVNDLLCHFTVIDGILDPVAAGCTPCIGPQGDIDLHLLTAVPLAIEDPDDGSDSERS